MAAVAVVTVAMPLVWLSAAPAHAVDIEKRSYLSANAVFTRGGVQISCEIRMQSHMRFLDGITYMDAGIVMSDVEPACLEALDYITIFGYYRPRPQDAERQFHGAALYPAFSTGADFEGAVTSYRAENFVAFRCDDTSESCVFRFSTSPK
jgi:hypothetical protein